MTSAFCHFFYTSLLDLLSQMLSLRLTVHEQYVYTHQASVKLSRELRGHYYQNCWEVPTHNCYNDLIHVNGSDVFRSQKQSHGHLSPLEVIFSQLID